MNRTQFRPLATNKWPRLFKNLQIILRKGSLYNKKCFKKFTDHELKPQKSVYKSQFGLWQNTREKMLTQKTLYEFKQNIYFSFNRKINDHRCVKKFLHWHKIRVFLYPHWNIFWKKLWINLQFTGLHFSFLS